MYDGIDISANTARISPVRKVRGTSEKKSGIISARIMKSAPIEMNRIRRIVLNGIEVVKSISIPTIPIRFPPSVTATNTQIAGSPTEFPTT